MKHAATVVLLRDTDDGPQAYLLRRVATMAFAAGMHVFPGGTVDPRDADDVPWVGPAPRRWAARFHADVALTRALVAAAVRETFEESGVLLAGPHAGSVVSDTTGESWESDRNALMAHEVAFSDFLVRRKLVLRADLLRPWAHWITPESEPRRFDTRFLVAALPAGQRTRDVGGEADHVTWVRPADAVAAFARHELAMLPPTLVTLRELSAYGTVEDILAAAGDREITPILPTIAGDVAHLGDGTDVPMPVEPG